MTIGIGHLTDDGAILVADSLAVNAGSKYVEYEKIVSRGDLHAAGAGAGPVVELLGVILETLQTPEEGQEDEEIQIRSYDVVSAWHACAELYQWSPMQGDEEAPLRSMEFILTDGHSLLEFDPDMSVKRFAGEPLIIGSGYRFAQGCLTALEWTRPKMKIEERVKMAADVATRHDIACGGDLSVKRVFSSKNKKLLVR